MNKKSFIILILFFTLALQAFPIFVYAQGNPLPAPPPVSGPSTPTPSPVVPSSNIPPPPGVTCPPAGCDPGTRVINGQTITIPTTVNGNSSLFGSFAPLIKGVSYLLMMLTGGILTLSGLLFDGVIARTITDMSGSLGNPDGIGRGINSAWTTMRDIANMGFIFILLFAAFKSMFELSFGNVGTTIRNIIIAALLINFSLFLTKVVIDASNIAANGFYKAITTAPSSAPATTPGAGATGNTPPNTRTLSTAYMNLLGLQSWYDPRVFSNPNVFADGDKIFVIGVFSSIFFLVTAVIMLIMSFMFIARYLVLIFVMIFSPIAVIAFTIPSAKGYADKWLEALKGQAIFAPVFFAMTWVVFKLARTPNFLGQFSLGDTKPFANIFNEGPQSIMPLVLNYVLVIGLSILALVLSKQIATKTAGFGAVTGAVGGGVLAGAAFAGRQTLGRGSRWVSETQREKWSKNSFGRAGLWLADKGKTGSFDARGIDTLKKVPGLKDQIEILGKAGGKGGFNKMIEEKVKAKTDYGKRVYGQTAAETEKVKELEKDYKDQKTLDEIRIKASREKTALEKEEIHNRNVANRSRYFSDSRVTGDKKVVDAESDFEFKKDEYEKAKKAGAKTDEEKEKLEELKKATEESREKAEKTKETVANDIFKGDSDYINSREATKSSKEELKKAKAKLKMSKENKFEADEYSDEVQSLKKEWEEKKEASKKRMHEYATRIEKGSPVSTVVGGLVGGAVGGVFGGPIGALIGASTLAGTGNWAGGKLPKWSNWGGNTEAAIKMRAAAEGKDKKDPKKIKEDIDELFGLKDKDKDKDKEEGDGEEKKKEEGSEKKDKKDES